MYSQIMLEVQHFHVFAGWVYVYRLHVQLLLHRTNLSMFSVRICLQI